MQAIIALDFSYFCARLLAPLKLGGHEQHRYCDKAVGKSGSQPYHSSGLGTSLAFLHTRSSLV